MVIGSPKDCKQSLERRACALKAWALSYMGFIYVMTILVWTINWISYCKVMGDNV
jgi:hypothetical protein